MLTLNDLGNTHRPKKKPMRVGRGAGSKKGKTCGRGVKGNKARSGYKHQYGLEGGQLPLFRKLPTRGFTNHKFRNVMCAINLGTIDKIFEDGDVVNLETLQEKGYAPRLVPGGIKILSNGELKKKVTIEARAFSEAAKAKLDQNSVAYKIIA